MKPKKRTHRPSIQNIVEAASNPPSMSPIHSLATIHQAPHMSVNMANLAHQSANKYLTYNKYNNPLGAISPMLRLKTFNVDVNSENSHAVKEYAMKRRSLVQDDDPQVSQNCGLINVLPFDSVKVSPLPVGYSKLIMSNR